MDAVQLERGGGPLVVRRVPVPRAGRGEVLIRAGPGPHQPVRPGVPGGSYLAERPLPLVPGFEGSGTVVAAGSGLLPRLLVGRRVAFATARGGTWAEYAVTNALRCVPVGRGVSLESAATLIVNPLTALAFFDIARRGKHAAIVSTAAASALGRMIVRLGKTHGVPVINVVRRPEQVELLRALGADHVLGSDEADFTLRLRELAHRLGSTLLPDAVGGALTQMLVDASPEGSTIVGTGAT